MELPLYLSISGVQISMKGDIQVYVMHMIGNITQENEKGTESNIQTGLTDYHNQSNRPHFLYTPHRSDRRSKLVGPVS
jgi:hypothetical protein